MNLDIVPLWVFFVGTIVLILIFVEVGFELGRWAARRSSDESESPAAAMGGAVLGLVAFMLAFTFGIATGRFDTRKELVREEANAIRTAYLRADFLDNAEQEDVKGLLKEYLDIRLAFAQSQDATKLQETLSATADIQSRLWDHAVANGRKDLNSDVGALFLESINEVINLHALRVAVAVETRIPLGIWIVLYTISILGMLAMGYQAGVATARRSQSSLILAVSFALVITLIAGLDRPATPFVSVTQKPLIDVQNLMKQTLNRPTGEQQ